MISFESIEGAIGKLKPPSPDAQYLNEALALGKSGGMFQNPLDIATAAYEMVGISSLVSSLPPDDPNAPPNPLRIALLEVPGFEDLIDKCSSMDEQLASAKQVGVQMFTSVMPTKESLPQVMLKAMPDIPTVDLTNLQDFSVPSITQVMSTVQGEQSMHEKLGTGDENPCLPVQNTMEKVMSTSREIGGYLDELKDSAKSEVDGVLDKVNDLSDAVASGVSEAITSAKAALAEVTDGINEVIGKISESVSSIVVSLVDTVKTIRDSISDQMSVAAAEMSKLFVANNPCMKEVLSPGGADSFPPGTPATNPEIIEWEAEIKLHSIGATPELAAQHAIWMANTNNIKIGVSLDSSGWEIWGTEVTRISQTVDRTDITVKLLYGVDLAKAKTNNINSPATLPNGDPGSGLKSTAMIRFYDSSGNQLGQVPFEFIIYIDTAIPPTNPASGVLMKESKVVVVTNTTLQVDTPSSKFDKLAPKVGLLSPAMQSMTVPSVPAGDLVLFKEEPRIVGTSSTTSMPEVKPVVAGPAIQRSVDILIPAPIVPKPTGIFEQSLIMRRTKTNPLVDPLMNLKTIETNRLNGPGDFTLITEFSNGQVTIDMTYELSKNSINSLINELKAKNVNKLYFHCEMLTYFDAERTPLVYATIRFYFAYQESTNQISVTAESKSSNLTNPLEFTVTYLNQ